jgi:hypothetical protein
MLIRASVGSHGSPWFNLLELIELRAVDWSSAFQLLRQAGNRAGFDWSEDAISAVLDLSGRRPYLIQLLGARVTDDLNALGRDHVTGVDVATAASDLLDEISQKGSYLGFIWNEAQPLGQLILWEVLNASEPLSDIKLSRRIQHLALSEGVDLNFRGFNDAFDDRIAWLTDIADALEIRSSSSQAKGKLLVFSIPLIQRWLKQMLGHEFDFPQQVVKRIAEDLKNKP